MITKMCVKCGKEYACRPYLLKVRKYCSTTCEHSMRFGRTPPNKGKRYTLPHARKGWSITCVVCSKEKYYQLNEHKKRIRRYCSPAFYHLDTQKEELSYSGLHSWIKRKLGRAMECSICGDTKTVDWANKGHKYKKNLEDWIALCRKHHSQYDRNYKYS